MWTDASRRRKRFVAKVTAGVSQSIWEPGFTHQTVEQFVSEPLKLNEELCYPVQPGVLTKQFHKH